jgi:hypothetical protein
MDDEIYESSESVPMMAIDSLAGSDFEDHAAARDVLNYLVDFEQIDYEEKPMTEQWMEDLFGDITEETRKNVEKETTSPNNKKKSLHHKTFENGLARIELQSWLAKNYYNPYPSSEDYGKLVEKTGLTKKQVTSWFTNYRARAMVSTDRGYKDFWKEVESRVNEEGFELKMKKKLKVEVGEGGGGEVKSQI